MTDASVIIRHKSDLQTFWVHPPLGWGGAGTSVGPGRFRQIMLDRNRLGGCMKYRAVVRLNRAWTDGRRAFKRGEVVTVGLELAATLLITGAGRVVEIVERDSGVEGQSPQTQSASTAITQVHESTATK